MPVNLSLHTQKSKLTYVKINKVGRVHNNIGSLISDVTEHQL